MVVYKVLILSLRNVFRNKRRSLLTFSIAFISFIVLGSYWGYIKSSMDLMMLGMIRGDYGHIQILPKDVKVSDASWDWQGSYDRLISTEEYEKIKNIISKIDEIVYITPRVKIIGLIGNERGSRIFNGEAVLPEDALNLYSYLPIEGDFIFNDNSAVIGKITAEELGIKIGDEVILTTTSIKGSIEALSAKVVGFYSMGNEYVDRHKLYISIDAARQITLTDGFHRLIVLLNSNKNMEKVEKILNQAFIENNIPVKAYQFFKVAGFFKQIKDMLEREFQVSLIVLCIIIFFSVMNTLYMSITDRMKEFSTMRTIGIPRNIIFFMIITEGLYIIFFTVIIGTLASYPISMIINELKIIMPPPPGGIRGYPLHVTFDIIGLTKIGVIFLFSGILGAILPALYVTRSKIIFGFTMRE